MKILIISKAMVVGAYHAKLREMASLGLQLTLIMPPRWGRQQAEVRDARDYRICLSPCWLSGRNHFHFYPAAIADLDADLVYIEEEPWSLVTLQFVRKAVRRRQPIVFYTWQNIFKRYPPPFNWIERYTFACSHHAIAGSNEARSVLQARGYARPVTVIPQFGVDPDVFKPRSDAGLRKTLQLEGHFVIGYMGRVLQEKGIADLVHVLAQLPSRCIVMLVGDGVFRPQAERLASSLGVGARLRTIPQVSSFDVPAYMNLFDALVLPSRTMPNWKEQFGRVLIEAMACQTPVVGSSSGEIPNVIGDAGLVFPEGDHAALAAHLRALADDADFAGRVGIRGRERVLQNFTQRRIAELTVSVFESVMSAAPVSSPATAGPNT